MDGLANTQQYLVSQSSNATRSADTNTDSTEGGVSPEVEWRVPQYEYSPEHTISYQAKGKIRDNKMQRATKRTFERLSVPETKRAV